MKKLLLIVALVAVPVLSASATITFADNDSNHGHIFCFTTGSGSCTTGTIDTTGATLIVFQVGAQGNAPNSVSDSSSNTWHALTQYKAGTNNYNTQTFYTYAPTTSTSQTFTCTPDSFATCFVTVWKGTDNTSAVFDSAAYAPANQSTGSDQGFASGLNTPLTLTYFTPSCNGELIASQWGTNSGGSYPTPTPDSGMSLIDQQTSASSDYAANAYVVATNAFPTSVTWSLGGSATNGMTAAVAAFKPATCVVPVRPAAYPYIPIRASGNSYATAKNACVFLQPVISGDIICTAGAWLAGTGSVTISDTLSTSFTTIFQHECTSGNCNTQFISLYCGIAGSSGSDTITIAQSTATNFGTNCLEFPPLWNLTTDGVATRDYNVTLSNIPTPPIAPTLNSDLYLSVYGNANLASYGTILNQEWSIGAFNGSHTTPLTTGFMVGSTAGNPGMEFVVGTAANYSVVGIAALQSKTLAITTPATGPDGKTSTVYSWTPTAAGGSGALTWSVSSGSLPTGLSISSTTGAITGTPSAICNCTFTLHVTDGTNTATQSASIKIATSLQSIALVQFKAAATTSPGVGSLTFTSNVTAGNLGCVTGGYGDIASINIDYSPIFYCTDSVGTNYRILHLTSIAFPGLSEVGSTPVACGFFPSSGANTVTCEALDSMATIAEFSGVQYAQGDNVSVATGTYTFGIGNITIDSPGSGQTDGTYTIPAAGGGGTGASVSITISGGAITSASVVTAGSGYTSSPTFTVSEGGTPGSLASTVGVSTVTGSLTTLVPNELIFPFGMCFDLNCTIGIQSPFTDIGVNTLQQDTGYDVVTSATSYTSTFNVTTPIGNPRAYTVQMLGIRPGAVPASASGVARHHGDIF